MSEKVVPLWKQELLKRRERNARLSKQENNDRLSEASSACSNSFMSNHRSVSLHGTQNKSDARPHRVLDQKVNSESSRLISEDVDNFATRQRSGFKDPWRKNDMSSRLGRCNESSSKPRKLETRTSTGKQENSSDISRLDSQYCGDQVRVSSITLDDSDKETLKALVDKTRGVDDEHIRPKDLKRMWKKQESKEELYPEARNSVDTQPKKLSPVNHISKAGPSEFNKKQVTPPAENSSDSLPQGNRSVTQSKVPKAYKSPYAKQGWVRPSKSTGEPQEKKESQLSWKSEPGSGNVPVHDISNSQSANNVLTKSERKGALGSKSVSVEDLSHDKVEDYHIPSVKSLLGLFGGRATTHTSVRQKPQRKKTGRQFDDTDVVTHRTASAPPRKPNLVRHHSEPNLYSATEDSSDSPHTTLHQNPTNAQSDASSKEQPSKPVALPSHHVSRGIEERMYRLRSASSTSEEPQISIETTGTKDPIAKYQVSDDLTQQAGSRDDQAMLREISNRGAEQREVDQNSSSKTKGDVKLDERKINGNQVENSHDKMSPVGKLDRDKKSSPVYINGDNTTSSVRNSVSNSEQGKKNHCSTELAKSQENEELPKQSFDKLLSMFGPRASKKSSSIVTDTKAPKSHDKNLDKQNNYVLEGGESEGGLEDQLPSTKHSNGISKNQQENKMVIKVEEPSHEVGKKVEEKPKRRRSLLDVEDPLDVLQLTKDPILLKGKQVLPDVSFVQQTETGRKPTDEIIKCEPDKKDKIAKINRDWDLNHVKPSLPASQVSHQAMPSNTSPKPTSESKTQSKNIPVTSIDIPVSSIDDAENYTKLSKNIDNDTDEVKLGNTVFYDDTLPSSTMDDKAENEDKDEFIPVSSIDDDSILPPPPEIIHDKIPEKLKSCFTNSTRVERKGTVSFFQNVFIHDYQCESAAAADWDFENGMAFSSYKPVAVRQYVEIDMTDSGPASPVSPVDMPEPNQPKYEEPETEEPNLIYNEEDSMGFTESSDSTAGALLF